MRVLNNLERFQKISFRGEQSNKDNIIQNIEEDLGAIDEIDRLFAPWDDNNDPPTHPVPNDVNIERILSKLVTEQAKLNECIENIMKVMDKFQIFSYSIYDQFFHSSLIHCFKQKMPL